MALKWIHIILLIGVFCTVTSIDPEDVGNANDYIDSVLANFRKDPDISRRLNPLQVNDVHERKFQLRNIRIQGLLSLYRNGDCSLSYNDKTVNAVAHVAVKDVSISLDYRAKAVFFWIKGRGEISVEHLAVKLDISSTNGNARLNSFKVTNLGTYKVRRITGATFALNWFLKIIANNIAAKSRGKIISALENEAGKALGNILAKTKLPIY